ncbi:MAG: hypothetical protein OXI15_02060 [Chromatiales bacterium]|nr:hypothetical protein [Chromatiales bacterium]
MTRPRGRLARQVALAARDRRRRVTLTHHEVPVPVERRVLAHQDVVCLDNGPLERPRRPRPARSRAGVEGTPTPLAIPVEPDIPPAADRVGSAESDLAGAASAVWADVLAVADGEPLGRGKTRKQIDRTLRGKGLYLFVAAGMHSAATARKAKGRAAGRRKTVEEAARGRLSVVAHWPEHLPLFDAALRHAMLHPKPLAPAAPLTEPDR